MYKINWSLFTIEQKNVIQDILRLGEYKKISHAIVVDSQEQERELEKFLESVYEGAPKMESKVKNEMKNIQLRGEDPVATPEDEAKWQALIDAERRGEDPFAPRVEVATEKPEEELRNEPVSEPTVSEPEDEAKAPEIAEIEATDSAVELAEANNIDIATVVGSGKNGKVLKSDVEALIA